MPRDNQSMLPARESDVKAPRGTTRLGKGAIKTLSAPHAHLMSLSLSILPPASSIKALPEPDAPGKDPPHPCPWMSCKAVPPMCRWEGPAPRPREGTLDPMRPLAWPLASVLPAWFPVSRDAVPCLA